MNPSILTRKGNPYIYSDFLQHFMYVPPKFQEVLLNQAPQEKMDEYEKPNEALLIYNESQLKKKTNQ